MTDERVEEGVGGRVVRLAGRSRQAQQGRLDDEEIELVVAGRPVQQPGPLDFRPRHRREPRPIQVLDDLVVEDPGVDDAAERRGSQRLHQPTNIGRDADVGGDDEDPRAVPAERLEGRPIPVVAPASSGQHERTHAFVLDEPLGRPQTDRAEAPVIR